MDTHKNEPLKVCVVRRIWEGIELEERQAPKRIYTANSNNAVVLFVVFTCTMMSKLGKKMVHNLYKTIQTKPENKKLLKDYVSIGCNCKPVTWIWYHRLNRPVREGANLPVHIPWPVSYPKIICIGGKAVLIYPLLCHHRKWSQAMLQVETRKFLTNWAPFAQKCHLILHAARCPNAHVCVQRKQKENICLHNKQLILSRNCSLIYRYTSTNTC